MQRKDMIMQNPTCPPTNSFFQRKISKPAAPESYHLTSQELKEEYMSCLEHISKGGATLREMVYELIDVHGATRRELTLWAVEAGYNERTIRSLLSQILCRRGRRQRKPGAGRKVDPEVRLI